MKYKRKGNYAARFKCTRKLSLEKILGGGGGGGGGGEQLT